MPDTTRIAHVAVLLIGSVVLATLLERLGITAGLLLGPLATGIAMAATGRVVPIPRQAFRAAQSFVGILIASSITFAIVKTVGGNILLFGGVTLATLLASGLLGYLLSRWQVLPGTVAVWGSMPGAGTAMVLMARSFGADARLVAVMSYSRVVCVAAVASVLAAIASGHTGAHPPGGSWFPAIHWLPFAETLGTALAGAVGGVLVGLPAGALVGPLILGAALNIAGLVDFELPGWLLAVSYALVGWRIGFSFTREIVQAAAKALPRLLVSIAVLILFCAGLAFLISRLTDIDIVTAYLATSPGGMDSVAIIAASTPVNVPFVMALQALRFFVVVSAGPVIARTVAKRMRANGTVPMADDDGDV